mmetsp:Transcript_31847/g.93134  ORF Transcript_31847/g.93134 Transcript_31847/m.93134 type:complete len:701 (-) Transcript_31847:63-2165(-)
MNPSLRSTLDSPIRYEFHLRPVLGQWLDIFIFLSYISIPVQLLLLVLKPPVVMDHRKLTSTFSNLELFRTRLLLIYFALFIIFCGVGHGNTAMCSASGEESTWCLLIVPGKMVIAITSGATSIMLMIWMPSMTTWLANIEIHRRGFTQVVVNELNHGSTATAQNVSFASVLHVEELREKVQTLEALLDAEKAKAQTARNPMEVDNSSWWQRCLPKSALLPRTTGTAWKRSSSPAGSSDHGQAERGACVIGYQRLKEPGGNAASSSSEMVSTNNFDHKVGASGSDVEFFSITFAGPAWNTLRISPALEELCGPCARLHDFAALLVERKFFMGQVHAALGVLQTSRQWRKSIVFPVTLHLRSSSDMPVVERRADCALKAARSTPRDGNKELDVLQVWLWGLGERQLRSEPASKRSSREPSHAESTSVGQTIDEEGSSRPRLAAPSGGSGQLRRSRERSAHNSIEWKLPDLEEHLVQLGRNLRNDELRQKRCNENGLREFKQACARLDVARVCLGRRPVFPRLLFTPTQSLTEVRDVRAASLGKPNVDLLMGQGLATWLQDLNNESERIQIRGVAFVASEDTPVFASVDNCAAVSRTCRAGEVVIAAGPPQEANGVVILPIENEGREGAVQVGHFTIREEEECTPAPLPTPTSTVAPVVEEPSAEFVPASREANTVKEEERSSSGSSSDPEDEQLRFRLGLMS